MSGLNEAARYHIYGKNTSDQLATEMNAFFTVVFEESNAILGVGALDGHEIKRVYTVPSDRGRGIGAMVMEMLEEEARRRGLDAIDAEASLNAVGFYERCGFRAVKPGCTRHGAAEFRFVEMVKLLSGETR